MNFLRKLFGKKQPSTVTKQSGAAAKPPSAEPNQPMRFVTFSSFDADRAAEELGEMYFQCPKCGTYERVNNIGKMLLQSDPTYFTQIECIKCKHPYNARVRLQKGKCPGFDYSQLD